MDVSERVRRTRRCRPRPILRGRTSDHPERRGGEHSGVGPRDVRRSRRGLTTGEIPLASGEGENLSVVYSSWLHPIWKLEPPSNPARLTKLCSTALTWWAACRRFPCRRT